MSRAFLVCTVLVFSSLGCSNARVYWQSADPAYEDEGASCEGCDADYAVPDYKPDNLAALLGLWTYQVEDSRFLEQGTLEFFTTAHGLSGHLIEEPAAPVDEPRGERAFDRQALQMPIVFDEVYLAGNHLTFAGRAEAPGGQGRLNVRVEAQVVDWGRLTATVSLNWLEWDMSLKEAATMTAQRR